MKRPVKIILFLIGAIGFFQSESAHGAGTVNSPILVLTTGENFSGYISEILRAEGFNEFQQERLADKKITLAFLNKYDIIILGQGNVNTERKDLLTAYVKGGGNLVAFRPDKNLSAVFGISATNKTITEGYIIIDPNATVGKGLTRESMQFHGTADGCNLKGAQIIAQLYAGNPASETAPAVVWNNFGKGNAVAFLYNLPASIIFTRQGNPEKAGMEMDGIDGIRAMDMFTNGWVDTTKNTINQADEQMRLLTHCIEKMSASHKPLPRFWYFPDSLKCLVTLTNDGEDSKEVEYGPQFADVVNNGAKMTLYIKETDLNSTAWVHNWTSKGFEMAAHFDDTRQAQNPDWNTMDSVIKALKKKMLDKYGISQIKTVTNHWFVWCGKDLNGNRDFSAQAKLEVNNGLELDNNYARYDNGSNQGYFFGAMGKNQGNFTGSGLSMKFASREGEVLNLYQHLCNVYDQQYMEHSDSVGFYECFKGLMDRSLYDGVYSYISIKAHNAEYFFSEKPLVRMLRYANANKIPVWTTLQLLDFLKARDEAGFTNISWNNNRLSFAIKSSLTHSNGITTMIPYIFNGKEINTISVNKMKREFSVQTIKGVEYAFLTVRPGAGYTIDVAYTHK